MTDAVNTRERFMATMRFEPCPRTPRWELGYWSGSIQRWYAEGLPGSQQALRYSEGPGTWVSGNGIGGGLMDGVRDRDVTAYFGLDEPLVRVEVNDYLPCPGFEPVVLEETDGYIVVRSEAGITYRELKPVQGMPHWLDYPVHNREEWEQFKAERLQPNLDQRVPANWAELVELYKERDYPLVIGSSQVGFFGMPRQILGLERLLTGLCEDPAWIHDIMDHLADFFVGLYDQVLSQVTVDLAALWEDMCYAAGPLISPRMFAEFMLAPYQRVTSLLRDHGIDVIFVDTDGDARKLIPLFLAGGVTAMYPFEANGRMDVAAIRTLYPRLGMAGGIDKMALAAGKEAIDRELEAKVPVTLEGGYIPYVDHATPPDVSWENFGYYRRKLDAMLDEYDARRWCRSHRHRS